MPEDIRKKFNYEDEAPTGKCSVHGKTPIHAPDIYKSDKPSILKNPRSDDEDGKMDNGRICTEGKEFIHPEGFELAPIETNDNSLRDKSYA